jgi:glyoxylase-like metal-dependent hydrolase (beta-lactamase superfamily II)
MQGPVEVAPRVWGLGSGLVNWYLVEDGGRLTAVDAGLSGFAGRLEDDLHRTGHELGDVEAVVLTHADLDHIGVAARLQAAGARVLVHADDEPAARRPGPKGGDASPRHLLPNLLRPSMVRVGADILRDGLGRPTPVRGAETLRGGEVLDDIPGRPRVVATHGHTPGHCVFVFEDHGALFAGDALCTHRDLSPDGRPSLMPPWMNVDNAAAFAALDAIAQLDAEVVCFGHGDPWSDGPAAAVEAARD